MKDVGSRIRQARLRVGISQSSLARVLKVNQSMVAHWEAGTKKLSFDRLREIAGVLLVDVGDLADHLALHQHLLCTEDEQHLIEIYRAVTPDLRKKIIQFIDASRVVRRTIESRSETEPVHSTG